MRQIGLNTAGDEISRIIDKIAHSEEGKIAYSEFLMATINFREKLSD